MKFMILAKSNPDIETRLAAMSDARMKESMAAMKIFNDELRKAGVMNDCDGLRRSRERKRVRFDGSSRSVDGQFAGDLVCRLLALGAAFDRRGGGMGRALPQPDADPVGDRDPSHLRPRQR